MNDLPLIFRTWQPRPDVLAGTTKDEQFAADLAQVVSGTAAKEYTDPALFFAHTYPTRGLKDLLKAVCLRISGVGGEGRRPVYSLPAGVDESRRIVAASHATGSLKECQT